MPLDTSSAVDHFGGLGTTETSTIVFGMGF
jgi:hypothetical protein